MYAESEQLSGHVMSGSATSGALALSFPLHRLEPYCTCVWLDPLVVASGPHLPPLQALPMRGDDTAFEGTVEAPKHATSVDAQTASFTAAYILASEPMDIDRQNVADVKDGARVLFANPYASQLSYCILLPDACFRFSYRCMYHGGKLFIRELDTCIGGFQQTSSIC